MIGLTIPQTTANWGVGLKTWSDERLLFGRGRQERVDCLVSPIKGGMGHMHNRMTIRHEVTIMACPKQDMGQGRSPLCVMAVCSTASGITKTRQQQCLHCSQHKPSHSKAPASDRRKGPGSACPAGVYFAAQYNPVQPKRTPPQYKPGLGVCAPTAAAFA